MNYIRAIIPVLIVRHFTASLMLCGFLVFGAAGQATVLFAEAKTFEAKIAEARKQGNDTLLVLALADCAYSHYLSNPKQGIAEADEAIALAERVKFPRGAAKAFVYKGWCHYVLAEYAEAIRAYLQAETLAEQNGDSSSLGLALQYKANLYRRVYKDVERSFQDHAKAARLLEGKVDSADMMLLWQDLGIDEGARLHTSESVRYLEQTVRYFFEKRDTVNWLVSYAYIGEAYLLAEEYEQARPYFEEVLRIAEKTNSFRAKAMTQSRLARIYLSERRYSEAAISAKEAVEASQLAGSKDFLVDSYGALAEALRALQRFEEASDYQVLLTNLQDSLFADKMRNSLTVQQANYEAEKAQSKIQDLELQQQAQRRIGYALAIVVIVVVLAALRIWRSARAEHRALVQVEEKNRNISQQREELEQLNAQLLTANEEIQRQLTIQAEQSQQLELSQTEIQAVSDDLQEANLELRASNELLALEREALERVNTELALKNTALSEAEEFRLNMLSIVSHDLKNPINSISGLVSVLLDNPELGEREREILRYVHESGERMSALVRDLLDTAARSAGKITLQLAPTELKDITAGVLAHHIHSAARKKQQFIFNPHEEIWVTGDVRRLFQVFDNLVSNALKYSPYGSSIWIGIGRKDSSALWSVRDEGAGFTEEDKTKAFGFFQKLSAEPTGRLWNCTGEQFASKARRGKVQR
ncbi:MAG: ATP-binding protein [Candidatus Kapabacteria bacterium]|nr:ATP-binding protein [Candidatus Kapabacteria bacterium]